MVQEEVQSAVPVAAQAPEALLVVGPVVVPQEALEAARELLLHDKMGVQVEVLQVEAQEEVLLEVLGP